MAPETPGGARRRADVLVVFGITGDLAKVMTFRSLYRLEVRGVLDCPIVGVAADDAIEATGEPLDKEVFDRFAARLSYLAGDFTDQATFQRVAAAVGDARVPVSYLEIPPFLFATVIENLARAHLVRDGRIVVEKPFGHDLASAHALAAELHTYVDEAGMYRIDHFLGKIGLAELLHLRFDIGMAADADDHLITSEERLRVAMARQ